MTPKELIRAVEGVGWYLYEHGAKHDKYRHPNKPGTLTIPRTTKDLPPGTLNQLMKIAGLK
jgi:predicted RNA binding protein YcfA (HicA-like mRNA interferase family)